jgi:hypothetical protein
MISVWDYGKLHIYATTALIDYACFYLILNCFFIQGGYVWLKANNKDEFDVPVGVKILSTQGKNIKIKDDNGEVCLLYIVNKHGNFWWQCIRLLNSVDGQ